MTPQEFFTKYDSKKIDFDGTYGAQCMDLMNQFVVEVFGDTSGQLRASTAYQSWLKGGADYERFTYKQGMSPQEGDIIYWSDQYVKGTGHVAIATNKANQSVFTSFDQNWGIGTPCHYQEHTYNGVVGWLRWKKNNQSNQNKRYMKITDTQRAFWVKAPGQATADLYVIKKYDNYELRHIVRTQRALVQTIFGQNDALSRSDWGYISTIKAGDDYDINNEAITHPEYFELK